MVRTENSSVRSVRRRSNGLFGSWWILTQNKTEELNKNVNFYISIFKNVDDQRSG